MAEPIAFVHQSRQHTLSWGGSYSVPRDEGFRDTSKLELTRIVRAVEAGEPWRQAVDAAFARKNVWLHQIITSPLRTGFFESVLPNGESPALDIGAGWGQISRPLAERRPVVALEPVAERLAFIRAAAAQAGVLGRMGLLEVDYMEIDLEPRFGAILAIGVLEWVGAFQSDDDPQDRQRRFLRKCRSELAPGGALVLGIENRIGLKYLLGCPDDHIGVPGIACLPAQIARPRWRQATGHDLRSFTYSPGELRGLLSAAGFERITFFAALPDYKLPQEIIPFGEEGTELNAWLAAHDAPIEHNGYDGSALPAEMSAGLRAHYRTLAVEGVAHAVVPSFFVRAE